MNLDELPTLEELDREVGLRGSFYDFVKIAWPHVSPYEFRDGWHIHVICGVLERVARGELRKVAICIPPGCMKSSLVSVLWPVWCWIRDPRLAFFATSFDITLTRRDAGLSLSLIQSEWFRSRWGHIVYVEDGAGAGAHANGAGGWRFATSVGSKATGRHPDIRIIDDPTKPLDVSQATLQAAEDYWNNTLRTRQRDPRTSRTVLIMQRLAVRDLAGVFEGEGDWHFVVLPMRYEPKSAYPADPRRAEGELLWPERNGEDDVLELERMPPRDRAAQLQQRPVPEGGYIIKREWIRWYDPNNTGKLVHDGQILKGPPTRYSAKKQSWDLAFKDTEGSDFVAGQVWGKDAANFYFLDGILDRLGFVETCAAIVRMREKHPDALGILIEDKANGPAVIAMLQSKLSGITAIEPEGGKEARLNAVSALFEAGNVWLPKGHPIAEKLAESLVTFPVGVHDDDVDACSQLLAHMHRRTVDYTAMMAGLRNGTF